MTNPTPEIIRASIVTLKRNKEWAEKAIEQTSNANMHKRLTPETNSIVIIMKHMAGNLRSRWTDFLTTDGEKEWRDRDDEFVDDYESRDQLMDDWNSGWQCLFDALESLQEDDLAKTITIRGEKLGVMLAIQRSLGHTTYHVGQIILIARVLFEGDEWETITIPRGESEGYNKRVWGKDQFDA
ncbi:MAG: DUF1572 family protein [Planctomycetota bacterium]